MAPVLRVGVLDRLEGVGALVLALGKVGSVAVGEVEVLLLAVEGFHQDAELLALRVDVVGFLGGRSCRGAHAFWVETGAVGGGFGGQISAATAAWEGGCGGRGGCDGAGQHAVEVCGSRDVGACGWDGEAGEEGLGVACR